MSQFLIFGSIGFWIALVVIVGIIIYMLETSLYDYSDTGGGFKATVVVGAFILLYYFFGSKEHVISSGEFVFSNLSTFLMIFVGYIGLGIGWAIAKWYFFVLNKRDEYHDRIKNGFVLIDVKDYMPVASKNKFRIMSWMVYWPFSSIWTFINDPVRKAFRLVYRKIEGFLDTISKRMFANEIIQYDEEKKKEDQKKYSHGAR